MATYWRSIIATTYTNFTRESYRKGFTQRQNKDTGAIILSRVNEVSQGSVVGRVDNRLPPVKGDHKGNYPFARDGFTLSSDIPRSVHTRVMTRENTVPYNGTSFVMVGEDTVRQSWLSQEESVWTFGVELPTVERPNLTAESITGALNDLAANQAQFGASVAEGRQTIDMLADSVSQMARAALAVKRGNFSAVPKILGMAKKDVVSGATAANWWLQYQYGWKPLMSDIHQLQEKVHEVFLQDYVLTGSKSASASSGRSWVASGNTYSKTGKISVKTEIKAKISIPGLHAISSWGLINPAAIAWELVPFSFVVDWFMPVGNTIQAATAGVGLQSLGGYTYTKTRGTYTRTGPSTKPNANSTVLSPGSFTGERWSAIRDIFHEFPRARFYADTTPFSSPRVANSAALLRQLR